VIIIFIQYKRESFSWNAKEISPRSLNNKCIFSPSPFSLTAAAKAAGRQGVRETAAPPIVERRGKGYLHTPGSPVLTAALIFAL
jgi:hypothetical protein